MRVAGQEQCFLVYSGRFDEEYPDEVEKIRALIREAGYRLVDWKKDLQVGGHDPQIHKIWTELRRSRRVIAILDYRNGHFNANVLYEYGFAHGFANSQKVAPLQVTSLVDQDHLRELPFDIQSFAHIPFDGEKVDSKAQDLLRDFLKIQDEERLKSERDDVLAALSRMEAIPDRLNRLATDFLKVAHWGLRNGDRSWPERMAQGKDMFDEVIHVYSRVGNPRSRVNKRVMQDAQTDLNLSMAALSEQIGEYNRNPSRATVLEGLDKQIDSLTRLSRGLSRAMRAQHDLKESPWFSASVVGTAAGFGAVAWGLAAHFSPTEFGVPDRYRLFGSLTIVGSLVTLAGFVGFARPLSVLPRIGLVVVGVLVATCILMVPQLDEFASSASQGDFPEWFGQNKDAIERRLASVLLVALFVVTRGPARSLHRPHIGKFLAHWLGITAMVLGAHTFLEWYLPGSRGFEADVLGLTSHNSLIRSCLTLSLVASISFALKAPWRYWSLAKYRSHGDASTR